MVSVMRMKINRLLEITILLLNRGTITARELAGRFEVSTRTIYRDLDVLSGAGVPVYTNKGSGGGISLLDSFALNKTLISEAESSNLLLALKTLQATKYPDIDLILEKIGAVFKGGSEADWINVDFSPWGSDPNEYNKFYDIKKAILEQRVIVFDYVNTNGDRSRRSIEPVQIIFKAHAWYLWGYCRLRRQFRFFRVSRLKNLTITGETFVKRDLKEQTGEEAEGQTRRDVTLRLRFLPAALHRIYDDFDESFLCKNGDGTCDVTVVYPEDEWVYGYILSFGPYVQVLEPPHIKKIIADRLKSALKYYESEVNGNKLYGI